MVRRSPATRGKEGRPPPSTPNGGSRDEISQPAWITEDMVQSAIHDVSRKNAVPTLAGIRLLPLVERTCVQILHIGSYDAETPTLDRLHNHYLPEHGLTFNGDHHEIYLSGARRTPPAKLKTILRQPVKTVQRAGTAPAGPANGTGLP